MSKSHPSERPWTGSTGNEFVPDDLLSKPLCVRVPIAAKMLGVGLTKLYELVNAGELQAVKLGRVTLIPIASLESLIARHMINLPRE